MVMVLLKMKCTDFDFNFSGDFIFQNKTDI